MQEEVLISVANGLAQMARVENGCVTDFFVEPVEPMTPSASAGAQADSKGRIYLGRVMRIVPHLQAAFVDIGEDMNGFLGAREAQVLLSENDEADLGADEEADIQLCVAEGDDVLVQIIRPASGHKGPSLTANITLPARHLVLTPCTNRIAVSRAITDEKERARLLALAEKHAKDLGATGMDGQAGWVLRTAATGLDEDTLKAEMQIVVQNWEDILTRADAQDEIGLVHSDISGVAKILRDYVRANTGDIIIEGAEALAAAQAYAKHAMPDRLDRIKASEKGEVLFERHDVQGEIDKALNARFELPSGGWIMIETTEAMTTIDVNSGSHGADALTVNLEAAPAIARQIRLRNIGGLIGIDFIDMKPTSHNDHDSHAEAVQNALKAGFDGDKVASRISAMSDFGVVEMTRKRERMPLCEIFNGATNAPEEGAEEGAEENGG